MTKFNMETYNKVILGRITKEDFDKVNEILKNDETCNRHIFMSFTDNTRGIFYEDKLIGAINGSKFIDGNTALNIAILKEYRGRTIGSIATIKYVRDYGYFFQDSKHIVANVSPSNESANKAAKTLGWKTTHEYDEIMLNEGAEFFNIYYTENPYCLKKTIK